MQPLQSFIGDDIRNRDAPAGLQHSKNLADQLLLLIVPDQIQYTVRNDEVHAGIRDQRTRSALLILPEMERREASRVGNRIRAQMMLHRLDIERQVLNVPLSELHPITAQYSRHFRLILARQRKHLVIHVNTDHAAAGPRLPGGHVADFPCPRTEIEYDISRPDIAGRITTTVVLVDDLLGQTLQ